MCTFNTRIPVTVLNIHYHLGGGPKDLVEYPVKIDKIDRKEDMFRAPLEQHCWM